MLLSGGQDSTTSLFWALRKFETVRAIAFDYGQRHRIELSAAARIASLAGVDFQALPLEVLGVLGGSALVDPSLDVTVDGGHEDRAAPNGLPSTFVPGRNLLFLSVAGAYALKVGATHLVTGVCETDYSGYPDCRTEFIEAMVKVLAAAMPSSMGEITIHAPLMQKTKAQTVKMARELGDDCWNALGHSVTCYLGWQPGCGQCPSCVLRAKGFEEAGETDPATEMYDPTPLLSLRSLLEKVRAGELSNEELVLRLEALVEVESEEEEYEEEEETDVDALLQSLKDQFESLNARLKSMSL